MIKRWFLRNRMIRLAFVTLAVFCQLAAVVDASITNLYKDTSQAKFNSNMHDIEDAHIYGHDYTMMDTGTMRIINYLGHKPTSGDTDGYGPFIMGYYEDTSPAVAYTEDTITTGLNYTPIWVQFMCISDTYARAWTVRRTDTEVVYKSDCCTVPFRVIAW